MYITSPTFIEKATAHARRSLVRVISSDTLAELEVLQLDFDDTREGFIGGFSARKLELLLDNFDPSLHTKVKAYMGFKGAVEEVLLGEFKIDTEDITYDDLKDTHKIVCYDRALDFDVQYEPVTLPATGAQIIAEIASRFGIEVVPYNLPMRDLTINELNINEDDIISYRQVISRYAQVNLATAHITADGKLQFKTVFGKTPVATIDGVDYTDLVLDKAVKPINALVYNQSEVEDPVFVRNESSISLHGLTEIKLTDNLWIDPMTRVEKEVYLDSVYNLLFEASTTADYEYHPFETSLFVRPDLEAMDTIIIKDKNDTTYTTVLQNMSFTWNGGLKGKMECEPLPETLTDYTLSKEEYERLVMGIKVDRVNEIITSTVQRVDDVESKASVLKQTAEEIGLQVSELKEKDNVFSQRISEIDVDISSIRLEVSQIGGYNIISNPIGRFGTLDWTFESPHIKAYANAPYNKAYVNAPYLKAQNDNGSIMVGVPTDTQAKYGFRVWKSGKALSQYAVVESGSDYSIHTKVKGTGVLRFKLREYTSATPTSKSSFFKETLLNTTNPTTNYSTYEKTVTLDNTTQSVILVVESDVSSRNGQFALFTNTSFNIGQPKPYGESITDMNNRIDSVNARVTIAEDTVDLFTERVETVEGQANTNTARLTVQAGEISSKVSTNGVISAINQTAELIKINANRINLTGYVTIASLSGQGTTTIDGSNIKTGTISANRINFNGATGTNVNLTGTITATSGQIGGWNITPTYIDSTNGQARFFLASHADTTNQYIYASNSAGTQMFGVSKSGLLYARDADISGKITATSGTFTGTVSGSSITGGSINIGSGNFTVNSSGGVVAKSITTTGTHNGTVNATGGYFTGGGTGQFSGGYHNSGSFSYGAFGGTVNSPSGTLAGNAYSRNASGHTKLDGTLSVGTIFASNYIQSSGAVIALGNVTTYGDFIKGSDIRLKDNFTDIHNEFNKFIYSLPIGTYTYKKDEKKIPQIGVNANYINAMLPIEYTKYILQKDNGGFWSANYMALVPMLVKVVQSQNTRLIDLEYELGKIKKGG